MVAMWLEKLLLVIASIGVTVAVKWGYLDPEFARRMWQFTIAVILANWGIIAWRGLKACLAKLKKS